MQHHLSKAVSVSVRRRSHSTCWCAGCKTPKTNVMAPIRIPFAVNNSLCLQPIKPFTSGHPMSVDAAIRQKRSLLLCTNCGSREGTGVQKGQLVYHSGTWRGACDTEIFISAFVFVAPRNIVKGREFLGHARKYLLFALSLTYST